MSPPNRLLVQKELEESRRLLGAPFNATFAASSAGWKLVLSSFVEQHVAGLKVRLESCSQL